MTASEVAVRATSSAGRTATEQVLLRGTPGRQLGTSYDGYAKQYTALLLTRRAAHLAETIGLVRALLAGARDSAGRLVDLACGPGLVSAALAEDGWRVTGVDASLELVRVAQERLDRVLHADATNTELPAGADVVVSTYSHTDVVSWPDLVAEAHRLLRPGGALVYVGAHPAFIGPYIQRRDDPSWPARVAAGYYHDSTLRRRAPGLSPGGVGEQVGVRHLTVPALLEPVLVPGWRIDDVREDAADPPTLFGFRAVRR
jgi:SAM-dependent methyltransferase